MRPKKKSNNRWKPLKNYPRRKKIPGNLRDPHQSLLLFGCSHLEMTDSGFRFFSRTAGNRDRRRYRAALSVRRGFKYCSPWTHRIPTTPKQVHGDSPPRANAALEDRGDGCGSLYVRRGLTPSRRNQHRTGDGHDENHEWGISRAPLPFTSIITL